jgi:hypothetical protein
MVSLTLVGSMTCERGLPAEAESDDFFMILFTTG